MPQDDPDQDAIMAVIEDECAAFFERNFERWAGCWVHSDIAQRLSTMGNGQIFRHKGWLEKSQIIARIMADDPRPNFVDGDRMLRENVQMRVVGDMAWVSFDQIGPPSDDVFVKAGLSHEVRILVRVAGKWKIEFCANAHVRRDQYECPTVHVGPRGEIKWTNKMAQDALVDHPVLTQRSGHLRARQKTDDVALRTALDVAADLTPMDVRRKGDAIRAGAEAVPLVLGGEFVEVPQIIWVLYQDQMCLVSFNDAAAEKRRLAHAKTVFGLSAAQLRVAASIVAGNDLVTTARDSGISAATARTHLQRMFDKTGVRSQTALVRVLLDASMPGN